MVLKVGKQKKKTRVVKENLNPFFNEKFSFKVHDPSAALEVLIYDEDIAADDFLGRTTIPVKSLVGKPPVQKR